MALQGRLVIVVAGLAAAFAAQTPADEIRAVRERSNRALAARDIEGFAAALAPDYVLVRGNGTFAPTREEAVAAIAAGFRDPGGVRYERSPERIELSKVAALAAEHGRWTAKLPSGKLAFRGTYLAMWRRTEAGWRIRSELFVVLECGDEPSCAAYRK